MTTRNRHGWSQSDQKITVLTSMVLDRCQCSVFGDGLKTRPAFCCSLAVCLVLTAVGRNELRAAEPTFLTDVMAVLSKGGCNSGSCHGNQHGKGGLKLSLRGEDPLADYHTLLHGAAGRRINRHEPQRSLVLLKPSAGVPHQGGQRFPPGSPEYEILRRWICANTPGPQQATVRVESIRVHPGRDVVVEPRKEVQLEVTARLSDGTDRNVTNLAVYETSNLVARVGPGGLVERTGPGETTVIVRFLDHQRPVRLAFIPARPEFAWDDPPPNHPIDCLVFDKLNALRIQASPLAADHVFLRRVHLDLLGRLPTAAEARTFVSDRRPDKRSRLVDRLLARPEFADFWALKWCDLLRVEEKVLDVTGVERFHGWIRRQIAEGRPLNEFARQLIASRGSTYDNPATNFYRGHRDPVSRGEASAQILLGVRLQCAKCHNHPFDRWTQNDYYSWAAVFAGIDYKIVENKRQDKNDKHEFVGEQIVLFQGEEESGDVKNPRTGSAASPSFLGGPAPVQLATGERLEALAQWVGAPANRMFARAQVNRIWYHLMGRGLVDPVDDFRSTNPASHPRLLETLADDFASHGFDLKHIVRCIVTSRTYQLSVEPNETNREDQTNYSRAIMRRIAAEPLLDMQSQVLNLPLKFNGYPLGTRAVQIPGVRRVRFRSEPPSAADRFLAVFGKPPRLLTSECERSNETTLAQTLMLVGDGGLSDWLAQPGGRLERLARSDLSDAEVIDRLYWAALSRPPSDDELTAAGALMEKSDSRRAAIQDIAWTLINSKAFMFRW